MTPIPARSLAGGRGIAFPKSRSMRRRRGAPSPSRRSRGTMDTDSPRPSESRALRIATWNVNSVRQRMEVEELGYNVETHGQKGFNGVAILSKRPFEVARGLPGDDSDVQSRYIEAVIPTDKGVVRLASVYLPNGNPPDSDKYPYKLAFMDRLIRHARKLLEYEEPMVLAGDFNVIPEAKDAARPELWT